MASPTALRRAPAPPRPLRLAALATVLLAALSLLALPAPAAAGRALAASASSSAAASSRADAPLAKKHRGDDDDAPDPAPAPDPDDAIAQMKACHAERGKGRAPCLAVGGGHCEFCAPSSALPLPAVCVHELEAKLMPAMLWRCDKPDEDASDADADAADADADAAAAAVPSAAAVPFAAAPEANAAAAVNGDPCEGLPEASCAATIGMCVWCVAAAVPSSCFTVQQAAALPAGVFACGAHPSGAFPVGVATS